MRAPLTFTSGDCVRSWMRAATALKLWLVSVIGLSAADRPASPRRQMVSSRLFFFLYLAATAALVSFAFFSTGAARIGLFAASLVLLGFSTGVLVAKAWSANGRFGGHIGAGSHGFTPDLLNSTINEMREGLVVIDTEMRIVASNEAAQRLFSHFDSALESRP